MTAASSPSSSSSQWMPTLALLLNAFVWGVSWWPFRELQNLGLHPLWATVAIYAVATGLIALLRPRAMGRVLRSPALWVLMLASGTTNAAFNWAVTIGDVVRVLLLFYLMPVWSVLLARWLLGEALTAARVLRVLIALAGALLVVAAGPEAAHSSSGAPWALTLSLADGLSLLGGFSFALNNVMLRRESHRSEESRSFAMFAGGVVVAGALVAVLSSPQVALVPNLPPFSWSLVVGVLGMSGMFLIANVCLQLGAARLPAYLTALIMLSEVIFGTVSAVWLGAGTLSWAVVCGAGLILFAAALALWQTDTQEKASDAV
jgi:drug/metabolite transporter (DMT)-like permease